jgi:alkylation response protein AidB-like acyl-CoA dehydrogenase
MKINAVKVTDGRNGYILNGEKTWIGSDTMADYVLVWAKIIVMVAKFRLLSLTSETLVYQKNPRYNLAC